MANVSAAIIGDTAAGAVERPLLVCFSHLRWNFVYQRPQHLMTRAGRHFEVLFVEEPVFEDVAQPRLHLTAVARHVTVAVPVLPPGMNEAGAVAAQRQLVDRLLAAFTNERRVLWYYTPMALAFSRHLDADACIFDNMDELSAFRHASPALVALERDLLRRCDLVFCGGRTLYEAKRGRHPDVHAFPSSIDRDHFAIARTRPPEPPDLAPLRRPRLGFFGVIDERMDIDLVDRLARDCPDWEYVMVGPVAKIDAASLPRHPNLHWLGQRSYAELPLFLAHWDVGIMPFALNESTRYISPTKTPEFLAAGVPVVSSAIRDVVSPYGDAGLVEIAAGVDEWVAKAAALIERRPAPWLSAVDAFLAGMSWDRTWSAMHALIAERLARSRAPVPLQATAPPVPNRSVAAVAAAAASATAGVVAAAKATTAPVTGAALPALKGARHV